MKAVRLIGPAARLEIILAAKAIRLKEAGDKPAKALFFGPPGVGKTETAWRFARQLAGHELAIEHFNGKQVNVDTVNKWLGELPTASIFGDWTVKIVDELDRCSRDAQDLLLTYLDRLPECRAFLGTSNLDLASLQERFQTRLQQFRVEAPDTDELFQLIYDSGVPAEAANQIAVGSGGNVRAALLDAESYLDAQAVAKAKKGARK